MKNQIKYFLEGGLNQEQIEMLHIKALQVIEEVGVESANEQLLGLLKERAEKGVRIEGSHIFLDPSLVDNFVQEYRSRAQQTSATEKKRKKEYSIYTCGALAFEITDLETGKLRPVTCDDSRQMTKFVDSLYNERVYGHATGLPQDVPPPLRSLTAHKIAYENSSHGAAGVGYTSFKEVEYSLEMDEVMGVKSSHVGAFVLNPLIMEGQELDILLHFLDKRESFSITSMPILGVTVPLFITGALVENLALMLAGFTVLKILTRGKEVTFGIQLFPFDMKYGTIAYGTPEFVLGNLATFQMTKYYHGIEAMGKCFHTNAVEPDPHAAAERGMYAALLAAMGATCFGYGGMLAIDKVFSAEQLLIDIEIIRYLEHVMNGFEFSEETMGVDAIKEVGCRDSFISHSTTVENFRELLWEPRLFENFSIDRWRELGAKPVLERARAIAREKIAGHDFDLEPDKQRALENIYQRAKKDLLGE